MGWIGWVAAGIIMGNVAFFGVLYYRYRKEEKRKENGNGDRETDRGLRDDGL